MYVFQAALQTKNMHTESVRERFQLRLIECTVSDTETYCYGQVHTSIAILASQHANTHCKYLGRSLQTWYASSAFYAFQRVPHNLLQMGCLVKKEVVR